MRSADWHLAWYDEMSFLKTLLVDQKAKRKLVWVALSMVLLVALFAFQKSKSANTEDDNYSQKKSEWVALLAEKNTLHLHWLRTLNPIVKKTDGDLIWNTEQQKGLMHFSNLPALKNGHIYQLWIYDLQQSTEKPVLAAVFTGHKKKTLFYATIIPKNRVIKPFKFLLIKGKKGDKSFNKSQSLLLAQP